MASRPRRTASRLFIAEMNRQAKSLKLAETTFLDPNGLARNQASARDLAVLTWHAMQNKQFREYVKTREHECEVLAEGNTKRRVTWKNTNRLLEDAGCDGVKTGTTNAAAPAWSPAPIKGADHLIVVVLGSTNGDGRYEDARKLLRWAWEQRAKIKKPEETKRVAKILNIMARPSGLPKSYVLSFYSWSRAAHPSQASHSPLHPVRGDPPVRFAQKCVGVAVLRP